MNCVIPVFTDGGGSADVPSHTTILLDEEDVDLSGFVNLFVSTLQPHISKIILLSAHDAIMKFQNIRPNRADRGPSGAQLLWPSPKCEQQLQTFKRYLSQILLIG